MTAPQPQHPGIGRILRPVPEPDEHPSSGGTKYEGNEVDELTKKVADLPALHPAALHGPLGEVLARLAPTTEAHPAGILLQLLALCGAMIGDGPHVVIGGSKHPARIWPLICGPTGSGRKGESLAQAKKFVSSLGSFSSSFVEHCLAQGMSSGEGLIAHFHTSEGKDDDSAPDGRLAVTEVEFGRTLAASKRDGSTLGPVLRTLWEEDSAQVMTRAEPLKVSGIHLVVIAHITPRELRMKLSDADVAGGTVNRFLPILVKQPKLLYAETEEPDTADLAAKLGERVGHAHHASARRYRRTTAAQSFWEQIYRVLSDADMDGPLGEIIARAPAYVLRLALLYAVLDGATDIEPEHLKAGLAVVKYSVESARTVFGDHAGNDETKLADAFREAGNDGLTRAQISKLFSRNKSSDQLTLLINDLAERGYITSHTHNEGRGRPTTVYTWTNKNPPDPIGDLLDLNVVDSQEGSTWLSGAETG